jgi:tryptophan-rich sensory protein
MNQYLSLVAFLVLVLGGGLAIGASTPPDDWYAALAKPAFNPPGFVFGPVWTILYIFIAVAGWRIWQRDRTGWPMRLWWAQLALNFAWSPAFFAAHRIDLALGIVALLLVAVCAFVVASWTRDHVAAWLFLPYAAWVGFATALNAALFILN